MRAVDAAVAAGGRAPGGWWRPALAAATGLAWAACFSRSEWVVAPWLVLAPLVLLLAGRGAAGLGWIFGFVSWMAAIPWIVPTLTTYGQIDGWLAGLLTAALAGYLAVYGLAFAWLGARLWRRGSAATILLGLPAIWVSLETLRGVAGSGFPWNLAAYAAIGTPGVLALASVVGAAGISFLVVFANVALALAIRRRQARWAVAGAAVVALALGAGSLLARRGTPEAAGAPRPVRVLQPNIQNLTAWDALAVERNYRRLIAMSREACDVPGALLVWPESAAWPASFDGDPRLRQDLDQLVAFGCPVLFNSPRQGPEGIFNAAYLAGGAGPGSIEFADKQHLVPFGEYVPLQSLLPFLRRLARSAGDFTPARELRLLAWDGERLGTAICFEVIFGGEVARRVAAGASILVTVTNDAWYGDTAAPWQHFRAARFRAAENRRPLLRAAITGISAVIDADGAVRAMLGPGVEGVLRADIRGETSRTPYARFPPAMPALALALAALAILRSR